MELPATPRPRRLAGAVRAVGTLATSVPILLLGAVVVGMVTSEVQAQLLDDPIALVAPRVVTGTTEHDPWPCREPSAGGASCDRAVEGVRAAHAQSGTGPAAGGACEAAGTQGEARRQGEARAEAARGGAGATHEGLGSQQERSRDANARAPAGARRRARSPPR